MSASNRCARCGKAAAVRRVLPPTDPLGVAGEPLPVCVDCAAMLDGLAIDTRSGKQELARVAATGMAWGGGGLLFIGVLGALFLAALIAFLKDAFH